MPCLLEELGVWDGVVHLSDEMAGRSSSFWRHLQRGCVRVTVCKCVRGLLLSHVPVPLSHSFRSTDEQMKLETSSGWRGAPTGKRDSSGGREGRERICRRCGLHQDEDE